MGQSDSEVNRRLIFGRYSSILKGAKVRLFLHRYLESFYDPYTIRTRMKENLSWLEPQVVLEGTFLMSGGVFGEENDRLIELEDKQGLVIRVNESEIEKGYVLDYWQF